MRRHILQLGKLQTEAFLDACQAQPAAGPQARVLEELPRRAPKAGGQMQLSAWRQQLAGRVYSDIRYPRVK